MLQLSSLSACITLFLSFSVQPFAQEENAKGAEKTLSPYFFIDNGDSSVDRLPLKSTDVSVAINGGHCRGEGHATVSQRRETAH
jgi:Ca-activated chloride channel homolog